MARDDVPSASPTHADGPAGACPVRRASGSETRRAEILARHLGQ